MLSILPFKKLSFKQSFFSDFLYTNLVRRPTFVTASGVPCRSEKLCPHPKCDTLIQNQELIFLGENSEAIPWLYAQKHVNMPMHANYCVKL